MSDRGDRGDKREVRNQIAMAVLQCSRCYYYNCGRHYYQNRIVVGITTRIVVGITTKSRNRLPDEITRGPASDKQQQLLHKTIYFLLGGEAKES